MPKRYREDDAAIPEEEPSWRKEERKNQEETARWKAWEADKREGKLGPISDAALALLPENLRRHILERRAERERQKQEQKP